MAEDYENYQQMEALARRAVERWEQESPQGIATAEDLHALEARYREEMDLILLRFEELHTRLWRTEERLAQLEARLP